MRQAYFKSALVPRVHGDDGSWLWPCHVGFLFVKIRGTKILTGEKECVVEAARQLITSMSAFGLEIIEEQICVIPDGANKEDALETLIAAVGTNPVVTDVEALRSAVFEREAIMSTGIGEGIAIPHVRIPEVTEATLGVAVAPAGIAFDTLDNNPVHVLVLFATPAESDKVYLSLLAQVMLALRDKELFDALVACKTPTEVYALLNG